MGYSDWRSTASGHISRHGLYSLGNISIVGASIVIRNCLAVAIHLRIKKNILKKI